MRNMQNNIPGIVGENLKREDEHWSGSWWINRNFMPYREEKRTFQSKGHHMKRQGKYMTGNEDKCMWLCYEARG